MLLDFQNIITDNKLRILSWISSFNNKLQFSDELRVVVSAVVRKIRDTNIEIKRCLFYIGFRIDTCNKIIRYYFRVPLEWMRTKLEREWWPEPTPLHTIARCLFVSTKAIAKRHQNKYDINSAYQRDSFEIPERLNPWGMWKIARLLLSLATGVSFLPILTSLHSTITPNPQQTLYKTSRSSNSARWVAEIRTILLW